jgi:hypothetical protein
LVVYCISITLMVAFPFKIVSFALFVSHVVRVLHLIGKQISAPPVGWVFPPFWYSLCPPLLHFEIRAKRTMATACGRAAPLAVAGGRSAATRIGERALKLGERTPRKNMGGKFTPRIALARMIMSALKKHNPRVGLCESL